MKTTKVLIVEDEMIIAAELAAQLEDLGYEITGILPRGEDALRSIESTPPELVLMDVHLKGTLDGIETAGAIHLQFDIPLIFLTSNTDDATFAAAKRTRPAAFLGKPYRITELHRMIQLVLNSDPGTSTQPAGEGEPLSMILSDRIFLRHKDRMLKIFLRDILYAQADRNYCKIFTTEFEYLMTMPLGTFEQKIQSTDFQRIHRSYIINLKKIDAISEQYQYITLGSKTLAVSRSYQSILAQRVRVI